MTDTDLAVQSSALPADAALTANAVLQAIIQAAANPAVDVSKMSALIAMQKELMAMQAKQQYDEAMARLRPRLPRITKSKEVRYPLDKNRPDGPSKKAFNFAPIEDIDTVIAPLLNDEGFYFSYNTTPHADGRITVTTKLTHRGGHSETTDIGPLPLDTSGGKNNVQAVGSTVSYAYRYGQRGLLNLVFVGDDDDGMAGGAEALIPAESVKVLSDMLIEQKGDLARFCEKIGVGGLPEITVGQFPAALNILMDRKRRLDTGKGVPE